MDRVQVDGLSDCQVSDGKSTISEIQSNECDKLQWYKGNKSLCNNDRYSGVSSNMLFIKHACQGIEGNYSSSINGDVPATTKKTLKLHHLNLYNFFEAPLILIEHQSSCTISINSVVFEFNPS